MSAQAGSGWDGFVLGSISSLPLQEFAGIAHRVHCLIKLLARPLRNLNARGRPEDGSSFAECIRPPALRSLPGPCCLSPGLSAPNGRPIHGAVSVVEQVFRFDSYRLTDVRPRTSRETSDQKPSLAFPDAEA